MVEELPWRGNGSASREPLTVVKVGGSLLRGADDLLRVASALAARRRQGGSMLVVASALKGVTDLLDKAAAEARDPRLRAETLDASLAVLRQRHLEVQDAIGEGAGGESTRPIERALAEVEGLLRRLAAADEASDGLYARLLSYGERLSVVLLASALRREGLEARSIDAEAAGLRAEGPPRNGSCDLSASAEGLARLRQDLRRGIVVLTGFYGLAGDGGVVLFGRGGSDDTACATAAGLRASRLEMWKDVPGFMSADPQEVHGAQVIREVSFDEVAQLGAYGARVVHHGCLEPLRGLPIEVLISTVPGQREVDGTRLVQNLASRDTRVVALASRRSSPALVGLVGEGVASDLRVRSRMLACLAAAQVRSDLVARPSGGSGLSCRVHPDDLAPALRGLHENFFPSTTTLQP